MEEPICFAMTTRETSGLPWPTALVGLLKRPGTNVWAGVLMQAQWFISVISTETEEATCFATTGLATNGFL
jgi:hypothetical protein